jgi:hypothetical protein
MKNYKKFVFGETLERAIEAIEDRDDKLRFYGFIVAYGLHGIEPELKGFEKSVWVQMKDVIDNTMPRKKGAPEGNVNAVKQKKQSGDNCFFENKSANGNEKGNGNVNENGEEEREEGAEAPRFSLSEELNPAHKDMTARIMGRKKTWNESGASPPCELITFPPLHVQDMTPNLQAYTDERIDKAIQNYATILQSPGAYELDAKPCSNFSNFMIRWVEKFVDEAEPFKRFSKAAIPKQTAPRSPKRHNEYFD